jgi:hypothetical protein
MDCLKLLVILVLGALNLVNGQAASQSYTWKNVKIGGGGGFVPGIVFNPSEKVRLITFRISLGLGLSDCGNRDWRMPAQISEEPTS